jgi:8-oxo-dGTP diphosphatase
MESRVGAHLVVIEGDRILLVRCAEGPVPQWTVPGGALELGETAEDCATRVVFAETGYHTQVERLLGVFDQYIPVEERLSPGDRPLHLHQVIFAGRTISGELTPHSNQGNDHAAWIDLAAVSTLPRVPVVDRALTLSGYREDGPLDYVRIRRGEEAV